MRKRPQKLGRKRKKKSNERRIYYTRMLIAPAILQGSINEPVACLPVFVFVFAYFSFLRFLRVILRSSIYPIYAGVQQEYSLNMLKFVREV